MILEYVALSQTNPGTILDVTGVTGTIKRLSDGLYWNPATRKWSAFTANCSYTKFGDIWQYRFTDAEPGDWLQIQASAAGGACWSWNYCLQVPAEEIDENRVNTVSVESYRSVRITDGAGGYTRTEVEIAGSPFIGRLVRRVRPAMIDGVPGQAVQEQIILVFPAQTDVQVGDREVVSNVSYKVKTVRSYSRSIQADVEAIR